MSTAAAAAAPIAVVIMEAFRHRFLWGLWEESFLEGDFVIPIVSGHMDMQSSDLIVWQAVTNLTKPFRQCQVLSNLT